MELNSKAKHSTSCRLFWLHKIRLYFGANASYHNTIVESLSNIHFPKRLQFSSHSKEKCSDNKKKVSRLLIIRNLILSADMRLRAKQCAGQSTAIMLQQKKTAFTVSLVKWCAVFLCATFFPHFETEANVNVAQRNQVTFWFRLMFVCMRTFSEKNSKQNVWCHLH